MKIFIKTTNERFECDQKKIIESSIDEPQILVEINSNQDLETQWDDDYESYSCIQTQFSVETNANGEK
jgi:hypothetical protein